MNIALFLLVLSEILLNWLYKKDDEIKSILKLVDSGLIAILSILAIVLSPANVFFYIFYGILIISALLKIGFSKLVLNFFIKDEQKRARLVLTANKVNLISLYADVLISIVAMCFVWQKITYIIIAIALLLILILVHEFGHYTAGKILGFKINEFSVGFGPAILQKTKKDGEKVSLRVLPLGGYCAFEGEDEDASDPRAFNNQKPWKRLVVLFSGVFFNFIFGIITAVAYLSVASYTLPQVIQISDNNSNPFMVGDVITAVEGNKINYYRVSSTAFEQFTDLVSDYGEGEEFTVTVLRGETEIDLVVKKESRPAYRYITNLSALQNVLYTKDGDSYTLIESAELESYIKNMDNPLDNLYKKVETENGGYEYTLMEKSEVLALGGISESSAGASLGILQNLKAFDYSFGEALLYAVPFGLDICWLILKLLGGLFTGATAVNELGGTITAVDQIAELTQIDFRYLIYLLPMIAMNLAVFNILPIPALDGARMVFVLIEMIRKKPISKNVEGYIHFIGLIVLFALVIFLDIHHFFIS